MTDFLEEKLREIANRLKELKPAVDEYNRLESAASALAGVRGSASTASPTRRRRPGRPKGSVTRSKAATRTTRTARTTRTTRTTKKTRRKPGRPAGKRRVGRRKGSGGRAAQALSFVQGQPGITIPELAAKMGI